MSDEVIRRMDEGFALLAQRMDTRFQQVDARFEQLDNRVEALDRHMHVLHEDTLSRLAALSEEPLATKREMNRGFAELKDLILQRIDPLEVAVRTLLRERRPGQP